MPTLHLTGEPDADRLLSESPLALLIGMLLDQQVPMEWAFASPAKLKERMGGTLDAGAIAALPTGEVEALFKGPPALHRFPGSMGKRAQQLCQHLVDHYDGDAEAVWRDVEDGQGLLDRVRALPGFGDEKAKIFVALLAKRFGVQPAGWEAATLPFSDDLGRSAADVTSPETLAEVRSFKQRKKADAKTKDG